MNAQSKHCKKCGLKLSPNILVCPRCGSTAPDTFLFSPEFKSSSSSAHLGRGARFWIGLLGIVGGGLCICLALAFIAYYSITLVQ
jgi:hypothetical protein